MCIFLYFCCHYHYFFLELLVGAFVIGPGRIFVIMDSIKSKYFVLLFSFFSWGMVLVGGASWGKVLTLDKVREKAHIY